MSAYLLTDLTALQAINLAAPFPEPSQLAIQPLPIALQLGVAQLWPGVEYISSSKSYDQHSILKVLRLHWQTELEWSILACRCSSLLYSKRRVNLDTARAPFSHRLKLLYGSWTLRKLTSSNRLSIVILLNQATFFGYAADSPTTSSTLKTTSTRLYDPTVPHSRLA